MNTIPHPFTIRPAIPDDCATLFGLIRELAIYERLEDQLKVTPHDLQRNLFGPRPYAEAMIAEVEATPEVPSRIRWISGVETVMAI
jgi:hypothetical protein